MRELECERAILGCVCEREKVRERERATVYEGERKRVKDILSRYKRKISNREKCIEW